MRRIAWITAGLAACVATLLLPIGAASDTTSSDIVGTLDGPTSGQVGDVVTFTVTATNRGPDPGTVRLVFYFEINHAFEFVDSDAACSLFHGGDEDGIECPDTNLAVGESTSLRVRLRVVRITQTTISGLANPRTADPDTTNNAKSTVVFPSTPTAPAPGTPPPAPAPGPAPARELELADPELPPGEVGQHVDLPLVAAGTPPYWMTAETGFLPNGVVFDSATGHIVGAPAEVGFFPFTAIITDGKGVVAVTSFRWVISGPENPDMPVVILPNPWVTPGRTNPTVTQSTIHMTICRPAWLRVQRPKSSWLTAMKLAQMAENTDSGSPEEYEEDHLIPLELGGAAQDRRNLWPEERTRARALDKIETSLGQKVCAGKTTLAAARRVIVNAKETAG